MEITFRKFQLSDVDLFMGWACNPEVLRYSLVEHWVGPNSTRADILNYFTKVVFPHPWFRAICLDGQPIGWISVQPAGPGIPNRGRGLMDGAIARDYWGRGVATLAVRMALAEAFKEIPHLNRVEAFVHTKNKGSQKMFEKSGFVKEGVLRNYYTVNGVGVDHIVYSIIPSDLKIHAKI